MKSIILPLILLLAQLAHAQGSGAKVLARANQTYSNGQTTALDSTLYEYEPNGDAKSMIKLQWDGIVFLLTDQTETTYLPNNLVLEVQSDWDGSSFKPQAQFYSQYDTAQRQIGTLDLALNGSQFDTVQRTTTTFGASTDSLLTEQWLSAGVWQPTSLDVKTQDSNNNLIWREQFSYAGGLFIRDVEIINRVDAGGNLDTTYYVTGSGDTLSRAIFTYNSFGVSHVDIYQGLPGGGFEPFYQTDYFYNANGLEYSQITQRWNSSSSQWINESRFERAYDNDDNITVDDYYNWNSTLSLWTKQRQTRNYYNFSTGINNSTSGPAVKAWPNPFKSQLQIELPGTETEVTLINLAGQKVLQHTVKGSYATLNTSYLPLGIYILQLTNGTTQYHQQVVKVE